MDKVYVAIDLKSFYASCECVQRGLDPLDTNLVVADMSRTEKTICLAVTPPLKSFGISGRARLFEVIQRVGQVNRERARRAPRGQLTGKSCIYSELAADPSLALDYIVAPPQMAHYMDVSARIYGIYLRYVAPEDIFAYSVDEVFIDATGYLSTYKTDGHGFARMLIQAVLAETGITATAGVGTNMYLCKVAMDIVAKHIPADKDGVRIAELNEQSYKENWWSHTPITDFWRVGKGISARLENLGIHTMGDIAVSESVKTGSDDITADIIKYLKRERDIDVGWLTADDIKKKIAGAVKRSEAVALIANGKNAISQAPISFEITSTEIYFAVKDRVDSLLQSIRKVFSVTPPELTADIFDTGIVLTGGGALLYGIDEYIEKSTGVKTTIADDAENCVIRGVGNALKDLKYLRKNGYIFKSGETD